jgi:hypothetical protein
MKIDPNLPVQLVQECVLCESGRIVLHDGGSTMETDLGRDDSAFHSFCATVDPNRAYITAFIPYDGDRALFFRAREVARRLGRHMQATVETAERQSSLWRSYVAMKWTAKTADRKPNGNGDKAPGQGEEL